MMMNRPIALSASAAASASRNAVAWRRIMVGGYQPGVAASRRRPTRVTLILAGMSARPLIAVFLGTRPEAIKLAPLIRRFRALGLPSAVIGTGQHMELVDQVLAVFGISLDENLELMRPGQSLDHILSGAVSGVGELLDQYQPRAVVVQGDTTSALGSSIAAFHRRIPVAHIEAGLRSHDLELPFPEEMNRRAISIVARWHFPPTEHAAASLAREGVTNGVHVVGNTVVDALQYIAASEPPIPDDLAAFIGDHPLVLATAHRRESWGGGSRGSRSPCVASSTTSQMSGSSSSPTPIRSARAPVVAALSDHPRAMIPGPIPYTTFVALLRRARVAVSDSVVSRRRVRRSASRWW